MKNIFIALMIASLSCISLSCSKDKNEHSLTTSPEATAENDVKSGGVYKGVIIGSSGTVKIILQNNTLSAEITIDGQTKILSVTNLTNWTSGQAIVNAVFQKDSWKITFSVAANGSNPQIKVEVPGHPKIDVTLIKEHSNVQVRAFEGTYATTGSAQGTGTWNFVAAGDSLIGIRRATGDTTIFGMYGTMSNGQIHVITPGATATGTYDANGASGTWTDVYQTSGTWTGKRTL